MTKTLSHWMYAVVLCSLGLISGCGENSLSESAKQRNRIFKEILQREDRRDFGDAAYWRGLLDNYDDPQIWERAILALARIGDPRARPVLERYAQRPESGVTRHPAASAGVRERVAFAFGEIEDRETRSPRPVDARTVDLLLAMTQDTAPWVRARAAEALGKIGDPRAVPAVVALLPDRQAELTQDEQGAVGLILTALFRLEDRRVINKVLALADHPDAEIRWQVGHCLYRLLMNDPGEWAAAVQAAMRPRLSDSEPMVRGYAARALGVTKDSAIAKDLIARLDDPDFFVQVEAVNALRSLKAPAAVKPLLHKLKDLWNQLRKSSEASRSKMQNLAIVVLQALGDIGEPANANARTQLLLDRLRLRPDPNLDPASNAAEIAAAKILRGRDEFYGRRIQSVIEIQMYWIRFTTPDALRAAVIAVGEHGAPLVEKDEHGLETDIRVLRYLMDEDKDKAALVAQIRPTILQAMARLRPLDLEAILRRHLSDPDDVTRRVAAEEIGKLKDRRSASDDVIPALIEAYTKAPNSTAETRRSIITTLAKFEDSPEAARVVMQALQDPHQVVRTRAAQILTRRTGQDYSSSLGAAETHVEDTIYTLAVADRKNTVLAIVDTTRGRVELQLFPAEAPLTVHNFVQLAQKGFYNNLSFMRVVPNFVIQGGDPRNDMEGGPGYTIRCEINMRPYLRGSVGMALDGKDTGGSQFFIGLSPQPRLDGGYTLFGRVLSGMDTIDNIVPGDKILNIRIQSAPATTRHVTFTE